MRFDKVIMNHQTTGIAPALVLDLINTSLPLKKKSGFYACISSRFTTVIHVVRYHQINDNCFNEPSAVAPV